MPLALLEMQVFAHYQDGMRNYVQYLCGALAGLPESSVVRAAAGKLIVTGERLSINKT